MNNLLLLLPGASKAHFIVAANIYAIAGDAVGTSIETAGGNGQAWPIPFAVVLAALEAPASYDKTAWIAFDQETQQWICGGRGVLRTPPHPGTRMPST